MADTVKISGHILKGRKFILKPVKIETMAIITRKHDETTYTAMDTMFTGSIHVTMTTRVPVKIRATPSTIHSIKIMYLLFWLISPNPRITPCVGNRCETPQINGSAAPKYNESLPIIAFFYPTTKSPAA